MSPIRRRLSTTARRRRTLAPLPAAFVALLIGGASLVPTAASATEPPASATTIAADDDSTDPTLDLRLPGHGLVTDDAEDMEVEVGLENPSEGGPLAAASDPIPAGRVVLTRTASSISSEDVLETWLSGKYRSRMVEIGEEATDELTSGSSAKVSIDADLPSSGRGVYGVRARFEPADGSSAGRTLVDTALLVQTRGESPDVATVMPITTPAATRGLITSDQLSTLTADDGVLTAQLAAAEQTQATLAVDPAIPAAIRVLGSAAPASATAWLERLEGLPNETFALQFGDADVATQLAAGADELLEPTSLDPYINGAEAVDAENGSEPTPEETPAPDDADPAQQPLEELIDVGASIEDLYWPDPDALNPGTLSGIEKLDGTALVPSTATTAGADGATVSARGESALVYDSGLSDLLTDAAGTSSRTERSDAIEEAVAKLWLSSEEVDGRPMLIALDRIGGVLDGEGEDASPRELPERALSDVVSTLDRLSAMPMSSLLTAGTHPVEIADDVEPARTDVIDELADAERRLTRIGSVLSDPLLITGRTRAEELQLLSVAWSSMPDAWDDAIESQRASLAGLEDAVGVVPPSDVRLLSSEAPLPVWIRNDLPYPVTVTLYSEPNDVRLEMHKETKVEAQASSNTRVQIPVEATLGSGDVSIHLSLESPTGVAIGDEQTMHVSVRADWERYGVAGLAALIVLLVIIGTIRTIRRRAAAKRAAARGEDETATDDDEENAETGSDVTDAAVDDDAGAPAHPRDDDEEGPDGEHR